MLAITGLAGEDRQSSRVMERVVEILSSLHLSLIAHWRTPRLHVGQPLLLCELFLQRTHDAGEITCLLGLAPLSTPRSSSPFAWLLAIVLRGPDLFSPT